MELEKTEDIVDDVQEQIQDMYDKIALEMPAEIRKIIN